MLALQVCAVSNKCSHLGLPLVGKVRMGSQATKCKYMQPGQHCMHDNHE